MSWSLEDLLIQFSSDFLGFATLQENVRLRSLTRLLRQTTVICPIVCWSTCIQKTVRKKQNLALQWILVTQVGHYDINMKDAMGRTAFMYACKENNEVGVELLLNHGAHMESLDIFQYTPIMLAALSGNLPIVRMLYHRGALLECRGYYGETAVMCAAAYGHAHVVRFLARYAGVNTRRHNLLGDAAIHWATAKGHLHVIKELYEDQDFPNRQDRTPLIQACRYGYYDIAEFLILQGCDVNAQDCTGMTAVMYASQRGALPMVRLLCERGGANIRLRTSYGHTALDCAYQRGHTHIFSYLKHLI